MSIERAELAVIATRSGRDDKLLDALIDKLPAPGKAWPRGDRVAWLQLMAMAFDVVYGRDEAIDVPAFLSSAQAAPRAAAPAGEARPMVTAEPGEERYYIAADGRALRDPGAVPVKATEVPGYETIWDERTGARDLDSIKWADGQWPAAALPSLNFAG